MDLQVINNPDVINNQIALLEAKCLDMKPNLGSIAAYKKKVRSGILACLVEVTFVRFEPFLMCCLSAGRALPAACGRVG